MESIRCYLVTRISYRKPVILWLLFYHWTVLVEHSSQTDNKQLNTKYAAVVDAGSSGSRLRIYRWNQDDLDDNLPRIEQIHTYKIRPGVHEAADNPRELQTHVLTLLSRATSTISVEYQPLTPFYFMATAGMRLILEEKAYQTTNYINDVLRNKTLNNFYFEPSNTRILSGEEEGVFCWLAVNYLDRTFDTSNTGRNTVGILELGGASTQIAFIPQGNILADKFPVRVAGRKYSIYVHSYLNYGQTFVEKWITNRLLETHPYTYEILNPCMIKGDVRNYARENGSVTISGSGDPANCSQLLDRLIYPAAELWQCFPRPCSIGIVYQPSIPTTKKFYVMGAFVKALEALKVISEDTGNFRLDHTYQAAKQFCTKTIEEFQETIPKRVPYVSADCMTSLYMYHLLTKAYKFSPSTDQLYVHRFHADRVTRPEWSLGAVLYEQENHFSNCPLEMKSTSKVSSTLYTSTLIIIIITVSVIAQLILL